MCEAAADTFAANSTGFCSVTFSPSTLLATTLPFLQDAMKEEQSEEMKALRDNMSDMSLDESSETHRAEEGRIA